MSGAQQVRASTGPVVVRGQNLTIEQVVRVARSGDQVKISLDRETVERMEASCRHIADELAAGGKIYGVTTGFGAMANIPIPLEDVEDLQNNAIWYHKTGAGARLPHSDVRAAMLARANSHVRGVSAVRPELAYRIEIFLNENVTPHVSEFGSIGASGDLVPLAAITGALIGLDAAFTVDFDGEEIGAPTALERLGLTPLRLRAKEGLAMMNGTAASAGMAALCVHDARLALAGSLAVHSLALQGLAGTKEPFQPFVHEQKPHPGQRWVAEMMLMLLDGSKLVSDRTDGSRVLIQDRYSLRCLPQYLGPAVESLMQTAAQIEIELNSANDNPLVDADAGAIYHCGNFLGQYVGVAMDQLRYHLGLMTKHLDAQIALLVAPEFSGGLPPSLVGNSARRANMGVKGLQLTANSIMPLLTFLGNSLTPHYPTHAEQFNQNINSQSFGSANLARQALEAFRQYLAVALLITVQAVDLRTYLTLGHFDSRTSLAPCSAEVYNAVREVVGRHPSAKQPYVWNDGEQALDEHIRLLAADMKDGGPVTAALATIAAQLPAQNRL